jgi:hypothetical protein
MPAPSNTTPETAFQITQLPFTQTLDVADAPTGTGYASTCDSTQYKAVWYRYTTGAEKEWISFGAAASASPSYTPRVSVWTGSPLAQFTITDVTGQLQRFCRTLGSTAYFNLPLAANTSYVFQITDTSGAAHTSTLVVSVAAAASSAAPAGSIVITDDFGGFPAAILDETDGSFLQWPFPPSDAAGEFAAVVPTGETVLTGDENGETLVFLDETWGLVSTWTAPTNELVFSLTTNHTDTFYALTQLSFSTATIYQFSLTGTLLDSWVLPGAFNSFNNLAVTRDDSTAYLGRTGVAGGVITAYDLVNSLALPDFSAGFGTERVIGAGCADVLADGRVVFTYGAASSGTTPTIRVFNDDGSVDGTYSIGDATFVKLNRWCLTNDPTTLLAWGYVDPPALDPTQPARFRYFNLDTGAQIGAEIEVPVCRTSGESLNSDVFSMSDSCPVFVLPVALVSPVPEAEPVYHIRQLVRRRVRRAPIVWAEKSGLQTLVRVNLFAVDMQPGVGDSEVAEPVVMIKASKDGGRTWSNERQLSAGRVGEYTKRINAWRWGSGRQWVFEIACTDAVTWYLVNALLDAEPGRN